MGRLATNRVVDAHATKLVSGFRVPQFVGINKIWPIIDVASEVGKFMQFFADASVIRSGLERALGDARKRMDLRVATSSYNTTEVSAEVPVIDRELKNVPESRRQQYYDKKAEFVQSVHLLGMEYAVATLLKDPAKYDGSMTTALAGTAQWSDTVNSTPYINLRTWVRNLQFRLGIPSNELSIAFSEKSWGALQDHPKSDTKLGAAGGELTLDKVANWLNVKECVLLTGMYASSFNAADPTDVQFTNLFNDEVIVFHEIADPSVVEPLWGGVARLEGSPIVTYYREEPTSSEIIAVDDYYGIFQHSNKRGYLARTVSGL